MIKRFDEPLVLFPLRKRRLWLHRFWRHWLRRNRGRCAGCLRMGMAIEQLSGFSIRLLKSAASDTFVITDPNVRGCM